VEDYVDLLDDADVEGDSLGRVHSEAALALVSSLPRDQAEAIMLRTVLGFDAVTAGQILGKSPGAVRAASFRGLRQLAKKIDRHP
jgi:RNA polymerase sigma-70 factor (ECF subfamily)